MPSIIDAECRKCGHQFRQDTAQPFICPVCGTNLAIPQWRSLQADQQRDVWEGLRGDAQLPGSPVTGDGIALQSPVAEEYTTVAVEISWNIWEQLTASDSVHQCDLCGVMYTEDECVDWLPVNSDHLCPNCTRA